MEDSEWVMTYGSTADDVPWVSYSYWDMMIKSWKPLDIYPPECEITGRVKVIGEL